MSVPSAANAGNILISGQAIEFEIEQLIDTWKRDRPGEYAAFQVMVKEEHEALRNESGMSRDRLLAYIGQIPTNVYLVVAKRYPEWIQNRHNIRKLHEWCCGERLPRHKEKNFFLIDRRPAQ